MALEKVLRSGRLFSAQKEGKKRSLTVGFISCKMAKTEGWEEGSQER